MATTQVMVLAIRPIRTDDDLLLHELTVLEPMTGRPGNLLVTPAEGWALLGDRPSAAGLIAIEGDHVQWRADAGECS